MTLRGTIFADAFEAIGIAGYVFDTTAEEQASAARQLDSMMAEWLGEGVDLGYVATDGDPQPDVAIDTPAYADSAISLNLALRLAPGFGKQVAPGVIGRAKRGYNLAVAKTLTVKPLPANRIPIAGGGDWRSRWVLG